jgi:two-component system response regulator FixJ
MSNETLVHVIDDDDAARDSLAFLLRSAKMEVRTYDSALAFLDALSSNPNGCIISDVRMPQMTGIELLSRLTNLKVALPVIIITGQGDVPLAVEAMKAGAVDFLEKPFEDEAILASVRSAISRGAEDQALAAERDEIGAKIETLSGRERQVLEGLVAGHPNKVIAYDLGISPRTVEVYRANVMTKMNAGSLSELVRIALVAGLIDGASTRG